MNDCHKQLLRIGPKRGLEENVEGSEYDKLVQQLRESEGKDADPFFPWVCCQCESELCVRPGNALRALSCFQKYGDDGSHKICTTCWFEGKDGRTPFADEGGDHRCPGCVKEWPRADRIWRRKTNKGQPRSTKSGDVTEEAYK